MPTVQEILDNPRIDPTFSFRPSDAKALGQDMTIQRGSAGWARDPGTGLIEKVPSGQARITGASQELLIEPQSFQHLNAPQNLGDPVWAESQVNVFANQGTEFGLDYDTLEEDTSANSRHKVEGYNFTTSLGDNLAMSEIVRPNGRNWIYLKLNVRDENRNVVGSVLAWFNIQTGEAKNSNANASGVSIITHEINEWHGGWLRPKVTLNMPSDRKVSNVHYGLANGDGIQIYDGQGSGYGVDVLHTQFTSDRPVVTSPILDGSTTRNEDLVKLRIPESDWNEAEGTYFIEFTLRQHIGVRSRIFDAGKAEIYIASNGKGSAYDGRNFDNIKVGHVRPFERNRLIVSTERDGRWGIALNGEDNQLGAADHQNAFVNSRPDYGRFGRSGRNAAFSIQEFRYLPRYLPKERRKTKTALS